MKITRNTDLNALAERMGEPASKDDAATMLIRLIEYGFEGSDTSDVPAHTWELLVDDSVFGDY